MVDIGLQVSDIVRTEGKIAATKSATEALNRAGTKELAAAKTEWQKANPDKTPAQDDIVQQLYQTAYNKAMLDSGKGTGGALQQGISAATAAVSALAGGNLSAAVAGGAAPYLAELIHKATTTKDANGKEVVNVEANLIAHAVLGAAVAQASGGSALAGASGGAAGEYIAQQLYPGVDRKDLSEEQRQTISALGTLAAGLAGGLAGDSAGSAVTGAQAGKNAVENNDLFSLPSGIASYGNATSSLGTSMTEAGATAEEVNAALSKNAKGDLPEGQNPTRGLLTAWGAGMTTVAAPLLLPATATVGSVIGAGAIGGSANVFNQLSSEDPFSATDALIATGVSALTQGKGFWFTEVASVTGAYAGAKLQGKDALPAVVGAGFGTAVGAAGGKTVEIGNKYFPLVSDKTAGLAGAVIGSGSSEVAGSEVQKQLENKK